MHELSTAQTIIDGVLGAAKKHPDAIVKSIDIEIGEFVLILEDQLRFCFDLLTEGTLLQNTKLDITFEKGHLECDECGYSGPTKNVPEGEVMHEIELLECPKCSNFSTKITGGRDLTLNAITLENKK